MPWPSWTAIALAAFVPAAGTVARRTGARFWTLPLGLSIGAIGFGLAGIFT